ncbi:Tumor necrosis factor receptor superfamily member 16 [Heterocephalus glaber]|uniref:Death domain-containing membrane protein NRADD n=1 Tax=Heterocephalus glaber TaxID=10181 RepID=G5ANQ8_HETGA|nr:death domain-containing membrane protein NRADD isoform X2 [Heterocephalus glaber]XP_021112623.1 death domain-containing membrane protein NRADD isoform X2 [Heterocephalus glaber]EHA98668.1 Tumor necrosis factor receptor superfamily member 16 [Heterocephalus glaber]
MPLSGLQGAASQLPGLGAVQDLPTPAPRNSPRKSCPPTRPSGVLHNSSHSRGVAYVGNTMRGQDRERKGVWAGAGGALAPNTSSPFPPEPPEASGSIIPVYCALLGTVVLGLLAYVAFKCWRSHKQRQQLAKARPAELGPLSRDQRHDDSSVFLDSPSGLEPCASSQGVPPDLGCRLYLHLPRQQQEEVERLLEVPGEPDKAWQGLAGHLGYQAEAVETMAQGQVPAYTLLRDWAIQEGSRATLRVLQDALAAMGREDVVRVLGSPGEGCSVV